MSRNGAVAESILAEGRSSGLRSDRHGHARAARDPAPDAGQRRRDGSAPQPLARASGESESCFSQKL